MTAHEESAPEAARTTGPTIYPCLGYRDAPAAIRWLCDAFGFEERFVYPGGEDREVAHAELSLGTGIVMLGSARTTARASTSPATSRATSGASAPIARPPATDRSRPAAAGAA
jgi:hypothetical protein